MRQTIYLKTLLVLLLVILFAVEATAVSCGGGAFKNHAHKAYLEID
ncbi:MAG: hypothetical protein IJ421_01915 [Prevotella sp.]|nr:hypothetical protein [Prevotella sp.]